MKKLSLALLVLTVTTAQASHPHSRDYTGFYASIAAGGTLTDFDTEQNFFAGMEGNFEATLPSHITMQDGSAAGLIGLGYSYKFQNHFVLGGEVIAELANTEVSHINELTNVQIGVAGGELVTRLRNDFAVLFKAGYVFHQRTQLYGLLGPRWGNFNSSVTSGFMAISSSDKESGYQLGVTAGIGLEHLITDHLSLGLEYAYTDYGTIDSPQAYTKDSSSPPLIVSTETEIKVSTNTVLAKLSYHF